MSRFKKPAIFLAIALQFQILVNLADGANILFFVGGIATHSHRAGLEPLAVKLADLGHNITFFSPVPPTVQPPHPGITEFCPSELLQFYRAFLVDFGIVGLENRLKMEDTNQILKGTNFYDSGYEMWRIIFESPEFLQWLEKNRAKLDDHSSGPPFDLFIVDNCGNEGAYAIAHIFGVTKVISYMSIGTFTMDYDVFGIPPESSWLPAFDFPGVAGEMTIYERFNAMYSPISWYLMYVDYHLPRLDALVREKLNLKGVEVPPLEELRRRESVLLANQHYSDAYAKSLPPFIIRVGGMHLKPSNGTLSQDLEQFVNSAKYDGFIYISFGSIITISTIPPNLLQVFFQALEGFDRLAFLWKWEGKVPQNHPKNVLFKPWFPQNDVLAHPKVRGFISQGGQVSVQQAIYHGVPLIIFPVNGDQEFNARRAVKAGNGLHLEFFGLTQTALSEAITSLTKDKNLKEAAKRLQQMSRDRPMSALDTAVWWTEYVLRTEDTEHLKPLGSRQPWWQSRMFDIWTILTTLFLLATLSICIFIFGAIKYASSFFLKKSLTKSSKLD